VELRGEHRGAPTGWTLFTPSTAERMRAVRKRRRLGSYLVRVQLDEPDIDGLVRLKLLRRQNRNDFKALVADREDPIVEVTVKTLDACWILKT
jgi:hypothetical protein